MPKIICTRRLLPHIISQLRDSAEVLYWDSDLPIPREKFLEWLDCGNVEGIYCLLTDKIDEELLQHVDNAVKRAGKEGKPLKVVSTMSVGFDHIDVAACLKRNIKIGNTPGVLTDTTADLAIALLLATARRIVEGAEAVKEGAWPPWNPMWMTGKDTRGKTVGIVGMGRIGFSVACRLMPFGCRIIYYDLNRREDMEVAYNTLAQSAAGTMHKFTDLYDDVSMEFATMDKLLKESDIITIHTVLNEHTRGLFSVAEFRKMKNTSILVNTSRGGVVDQEALLAALDAGEIQGAGLDVVEPEPMPSSHPLVKHPKITIVPHIGSASVETRTKMAEMAAENCLAGVLGTKIPNEVTK